MLFSKLKDYSTVPCFVLLFRKLIKLNDIAYNNCQKDDTGASFELCVKKLFFEFFSTKKE